MSTLTKARQVVVSCHDFKADRSGDDWFRKRRWLKRLSCGRFVLEPRSRPPRRGCETPCTGFAGTRAMDYVRRDRQTATRRAKEQGPADVGSRIRQTPGQSLYGVAVRRL